MKADFPSFRTTEILFTSPMKKKKNHSASANHSNYLQLCTIKNNLYSDAYKNKDENNCPKVNLLLRTMY